jgi:hypothetical protein
MHSVIYPLTALPSLARIDLYALQTAYLQSAAIRLATKLLGDVKSDSIVCGSQVICCAVDPGLPDLQGN